MAGKGTLQFDATVSADQINSLLRALRTEAEGAAKSINDAFGGTVSKKIVLETVTDENGVRKLVAVEKERLSVTDQIIAAQKKLDNIQQGSLTSLRQQVNQAKQTRDEIARTVIRVNQYGKAVRQTNADWIVANQRVSQIQRQLDLASASGFWDRVKTSLNVQGLVNFSNGLNQVVQGFQAASIAVGSISSSINSFVTALADLQSFGLAFKAIGAGAVGGAVALQESSRIALGLGVNLNTVRQGFQQLTPVVLNSGGTIEDVSKIVNALSSRFAAFSISGDRARRVTNGVIQAFAKGKLQAEELTQQISEADPAFKTDFANAIGVSVAELEKLVKAGQITSDVLIKAIPQLDKTALLYGKLGNSAVEAVAGLEQGNTTIDQVRNKLQALGQLSFERLAKAIEPVLLVFLKGQAIVTDFFDRVSRLDVIKTLGGVAAGISDQFLRLLDVSLRLAETILSLVDSFDKLTLGLGIPALVVGKLSLSLSSLINGLTNGSKQAGLFAQAVSSAKRPLDGLNSTFESVFLGVTKTQKEIVNLQTRQTALGSTSAKVASRIEVLRKRINEYQNAITRTRVSGATTLGGAQAQKQIDEYQRKITSLSNNLVKYENIAGNLAEKQASLGASVEALSKRKGRLAAGTAFLANTWKNATGAVRGLASALGPVGLLLAALTAIQSANNQIFGEANKITNESKDRSESLAQAITSLTGTATSAQAPLSGFAAAWLNISAILVNATKAVRDLFDALLSSLPKVTSGVGPLEAAFRRAGAVIGFVLGGAIIGGAVGGGPLGAAIGGLVGLVVGLGATSDTTAAELQKVVESAKAVGAAAKSEGKLLQDLGKGLEDAAQKINKTKEAQEALQKELAKKQQAGEGQSQTADLTEKISQNQAELNKQVQEFNSAYVASKRAIEGLAAEQAKIEGIQKKLIQDQKSLAGGDQKQLENLEKGAQLIEKQAELQIKLNKLKNLQAAPPTEPPDQRRAARDARGKEIQRLTEDLEEAGRAVQKFQAEGSVDPAALQKYQEYRAALKQVESALGIVTENLEANRASQERAARAAGILTEEQKKTVSTIGSLNKSLRDNQELLENDVNPNVTPAKWIELNKTIADQGIELQQLRDKAEGLQALFGAQILKIRVDNKEVNDSLENANRLIQFYEKAIAVIDINAPELPKIIGELIEAESRREQLNAKKATITLELLQTGVESGSIIETLSIIDKQLAALEQIKVQIPITSSDIDPVIEEINTLNIRKDLGAKSSAELQRLLDTENANERKRLLDEQTNAEKAAIAERKQALQDELTQVKELAAARIDTLRQLGPAEQALARFREDELRKQARKGSPEERLQARAQLERLSREKEIARITREAKKKEADIQKKIAEEEKKEKDLEKKAREENLKIQQELLRIAKEEKEERLAIAQAILDARKSGTGAPATGSTGDAVTDIQLAEQASENLVENLGEAGTALSGAQEPAENVATSLTTGAEQAQAIETAIKNLDGLVVTVNVVGVPGLWTGGPTQAGMQYRVNELGQEGFLSATGRLSAINKPRNAMWRAPSTGTVIPAHIWSSLKIPQGGVQTTVKPALMGSSVNGLSRVVKALRGALGANASGTQEGLSEIAAVQSQQALQIGKLGRAIDRLADKRWDVGVNVRSDNGVAYLDALNRRI